MNVYQFMDSSPITTFFLALFILATATTVAKYLAVMVRGWRPRKAKNLDPLLFQPSRDFGNQAKVSERGQS